jgi:DNA uptake protein ComE-like DNA-binding protein
MHSAGVRSLLTVVLIVLAGLLAAGGGARAAVDLGDHVDLNSASLEEVLQLPLPEDLARRIVDYRTYVRYFDNVYQLNEVDGMTPEIFTRLKPLVATLPPPEADASIARLSAGFRQVQRYLGQEGSNEGLADEYLDKMRHPENINRMDLFDLMSYQMVSPVDATNIIKARDRLGQFESTRQLRRSEGLRYYSYRNLRDFVVFNEEDAGNKSGLTGYYQTRYWETPFYAGDDEVNLAGLYETGFSGYGVDQIRQPGWMNKLRLRGNDGFTAGLLTAREYDEDEWDATAKGFVGFQDMVRDGWGVKSLIFGNYRAAFGLGLVMDNTDFIHFRKTGFGWNKRHLGIHGDMSRSYEYKLTGAATELALGPVNASFFASSDKRDGILNQNGTIASYVTMRPRLSTDYVFDKEWGLKREAFQENLVGGNAKLMLAPGTFIGVTGFQAHYDRAWQADVETFVQADNLHRLTGRDSEIAAGYTSYFDYGDTIEFYKWRRVMGVEAQTVVGNTSLQAEYAFQQDPRNSFLDSKNPDAYIVNLFSQWSNLHLLAIYRDYDLGFDNPYNRAFSNDSRYEQTLMDAPYYLNDPYFSWVEMNAPQPKPEKGLFLDARYRISRTLILSGLQFDKWKRKADGADMMRYTIKGEYQPIFNLRFRVRHRYSSRSEDNPDDVRLYRNWETRWQLIALLSNYNRLGFTYMTSNVFFPSRPRLSGALEPGEGYGSSLSGVGTAASPAHALEVRYEHNMTPGLKFTVASSLYDGFFWNFEGNEFVLMDGNGFRNWFKVESRISERMLFQLKVTRDHNLPRTYVDVREWDNDDYGINPESIYQPKDQTFVRLQMDYTF